MMRLPAPRTVDVIVLGGGIAGVAVAAHLAGKAKVALLEREPLLGQHTTGRSAAMFLPSYGGPGVRRLTRASRAFLAAPPSAFERPLLTPRAALHVARKDQLGDLAALAGDLPLAAQLTAVQVRRLAPSLRPGAVGGGLLEANAADIDVAELHAGFVRMCRVGGGLVRTGMEGPTARRARGQWLAQAADGTSFRAPVLVNAAGAWADAVALEAGVAPIGLAPLRRTAVLIDPPDDDGFAGRPIVKGIGEGFYYRPFGGGLLLTACDETPSGPCDPQPSQLDIAAAVARFESVATWPVRRVRRAWAGLRTFAADRRPVIGWAADSPGFFWMAGLGGVGVQTAPAAGRLAATLILGRVPPADLAGLGVRPQAFSPLRLSAAATVHTPVAA